jgi:hypothetical protein
MPWPLGEWSERCGRIRIFTVRVLKPPPLPLGYTCEWVLRIGAPGEIRTHTARVLSAMPPAVGLPARGAPYRLRSCVCALPKRCPAIERRERGARSIDSNVHLSRYKPEALPVELYGRSGAGSLDRTDGLRVTRAALCQLSYASEKKDKWTALLLRISEERQSHERRPISGRSRCQTARPSLANFKRSHAFARALSASGNRFGNAGSGSAYARARGANSAKPISGVNFLRF